MASEIRGSDNFDTATVGITSGTAVASTSGTSIDFTGIPAGTKRITVLFNGVSTNGTSQSILQIGDSGGIEVTGYASAGGQIYNVAAGIVAYTTGFGMVNNIASIAMSGAMTLLLFEGNTWVVSGTTSSNIAGAGVLSCQVFGGNKTLSGELDRIRLTNVNGTDTFDAGAINILYE